MHRPRAFVSSSTACPDGTHAGRHRSTIIGHHLGGRRVTVSRRGTNRRETASRQSTTASLPTRSTTPFPAHMLGPTAMGPAGTSDGAIDFTSTPRTAASGGPRRAHATNASTAAGGPAAVASTDPSRRLATAPDRPRRRPSPTADAR
eukprot:TRINITY_DN13010_c0_g1_i1.p2 TRINITY_DN13010_c0_g1~~TRINITY_DN13010_c0_g1_i1.p2  ORF type:complete len:147 (-),score=8.50 TRINITY_DN13010_c0_g1_i1:13-453(-)